MFEGETLAGWSMVLTELNETIPSLVSDECFDLLLELEKEDIHEVMSTGSNRLGHNLHSIRIILGGRKTTRKTKLPNKNRLYKKASDTWVVVARDLLAGKHFASPHTLGQFFHSSYPWL